MQGDLLDEKEGEGEEPRPPVPERVQLSAPWGGYTMSSSPSSLEYPRESLERP